MHQAFEKVIILFAQWMHLSMEVRAQNALITIMVAILTVCISLPLCYNTFLNLAQALPSAYVDLLRQLKEEVAEKLSGRYEIIDSHFWMLDMSWLVGSVKVAAKADAAASKEDIDVRTEVKRIYSPFVAELTVELAFSPTSPPK